MQVLISGLLHTLLYFSGEITGIVFRKGFDNAFHYAAFRRIVELLDDRNEFYSIFLQQIFVLGTIISVSGKAIQLMYEYDIKSILPGICDHLLELRPLIICSRVCVISIDIYNIIAM